jgi:hypothetical protein
MKALLPLFVAFMVCGQSLNAQVISSAFPVEPITDDLNGALNQFLLGSGVTSGDAVSSPLSNFAIASFTGGGPYIGLDSGLVLCTAGVNGFGFSQQSTPQPDLLAVANSVPQLLGASFQVSSVNDVAEVSFDFVALGDSLSFNFVFASTEYAMFVNTAFNDVFAFFLAGPGLEGPYSAPEGYPSGAINIAVVPGSNPPLPITVSSVNAQLNSEYFINNQSAFGSPANVDFIFNGFTEVITAHANGLIPGEV